MRDDEYGQSADEQARKRREQANAAAAARARDKRLENMRKADAKKRADKIKKDAGLVAKKRRWGR
jgi:hypothetical protein